MTNNIEVKEDKLNVLEISDLGISLEAVADKIIILVDGYKSGYECKTCSGTGRVESPIVSGAKTDCSDCKGKGKLLEIPDTAKSMPSTGVVVSMGPDTKFMRYKKANATEEELNNIGIQIGTRVVYGIHVGTPIPIKGNIKLRIMRENEPLCRIFGSDIGDKEILDYNQGDVNL